MYLYEEVQSPRDPSGSTSRVLHSSVLGAQRIETCIPTECPPMSVGGPLVPNDQNEERNSQVVYFQKQDNAQRDWETSFALVSTTRPTSVVEGSDQEIGQGGDSTIRSDGSMVRVSDDQSAVDSLHFEIQRLQARIMSRLREPPTPGSMVYGSSQVNIYNHSKTSFFLHLNTT